MRIDFAIITVLDTEHDVNAATLQVVFVQAQVPSSDLEHMK